MLKHISLKYYSYFILPGVNYIYLKYIQISGFVKSFTLDGDRNLKKNYKQTINC